MLSEDKIKKIYEGVKKDLDDYKPKTEDISTGEYMAIGTLSGMETVLKAILEIKDGE